MLKHSRCCLSLQKVEVPPRGLALSPRHPLLTIRNLIQMCKLVKSKMAQEKDRNTKRLTATFSLRFHWKSLWYQEDLLKYWHKGTLYPFYPCLLAFSCTYVCMYTCVHHWYLFTHVCTYTYVHTYICTYTYVHTYICTYTYVHTYSYSCAYVHVLSYSIHIHIQIFMCVYLVHLCMYVCMYVRMYVRMSTCVYIPLLPCVDLHMNLRTYVGVYMVLCLLL